MVDHKDEIRRMLDEQRNDSHMQIEHHFRNTAKELHMNRYAGHRGYGNLHANGYLGNGPGYGYDGFAHPGAGYHGAGYGYGQWEDPNLTNTFLANDGKSKK